MMNRLLPGAPRPCRGFFPFARAPRRLAAVCGVLLAGCMPPAGAGSPRAEAPRAAPLPASPVQPDPGAAAARPRVVVLTDIGGAEPDDEQSLIRLMLYSNEFEIEGLIANTSAWQRTYVRPDLIHRIVEAYGRVRPNLARHAAGYPSAESLLATIRTGRVEVGMEGVGEGMSTEASEHIITVVDRPDPRPVWILLWGGGVDLGQALHDVRARRTPEEVSRFISRLRVYDIAGQDDVGAWATHNFPGLFWIRSVEQFEGMSRRFDRPHETEQRGGNEAVIEHEWITEHVQGHGPLGALYRHARYQYEGDSPSFLHLLPTGLGDPEQVHFGTWGGRFERKEQKNLGAVPRVVTQGRYHDYWMFGDAVDTWTYGTVTYRNRFAPLFRWREAFQHDFAARMDWSVTPSYEDANHNPVAVFRGDSTREVVHLTTRPGAVVQLSAEGSSDPDGDGLAFHWYQYPEAGTYPGEIHIEEPTAATTRFTVPPVDSAQTIHVVLSVRDDGEPSLFAYRRVVLAVVPQ